MARLKKGINGSFSGKVGTVVGSSWNGIEYIRSKPVFTKPKTEAQLKNQYVFELTQKWLQPLKEFLDIGFKGYSRSVFGINAAKSILYKTALVKDGYNSTIEPSLAVMSYGDLGLPEQVQVELDAENQLLFSWDANPGENKDPYDQIMLLAYDFQSKKAKFKLRGEFRKKGSDHLDLSGMPAGTYQIYVAFVAEDRSRQSMSQYLGSRVKS